MDKRQKLFMSAERAIMRLAKLAHQIRNKDLADWMIEGDKLGQCRAGDLQFVAEWLDDAVQLGKIHEFEQSKPHPACAVCGKDGRRFDVRKHTRYCSDRCRQKAYRQRNGSGQRPRKQTVTNSRSVTVHAIDREAKT
jgi:predicted nucleic acid-binding Zn ribbon protein